MSAELFIARRYLLHRREGAWGWLITWMATGSVMIGVASLIVTLAVMTGFREDIRTKILGVQPHLIITSVDNRLPDDTPAIDETLGDDPEIAAWSPYITGQILIGCRSQNSGGLIKGINPTKEPDVTNVKNRLFGARWEELSRSITMDGQERPRIFLGQELARHIGASLGDRVWIIAPGTLTLGSFSLPQAHFFTVAGFVQTGLYDYDSSLAYIHIDQAKKVFESQAWITGIGVRLNNPEQAEAKSHELQEKLRSAYWIRSWLSLNRNLFSALKLEKTVMFIILTLVTLVASFMIVSNLLLIITQKVREIGILRAMGATSSVVRKIFLLQGLLMGVIGTFLGTILGVVISIVLAKTNFIRLPADVYYIDRLPIKIDALDVATVIVAAVGIVFLATLYPAHRATKLDPLDAIRYG